MLSCLKDSYLFFILKFSLRYKYSKYDQIFSHLKVKYGFHCFFKEKSNSKGKHFFFKSREMFFIFNLVQ